MIKEVWKTKECFKDYQISNHGRIKSLKFDKERILKPIVINCGYSFVFFCKKGNINSFSIHRLVAQTFIPNPDNKPCVNHKDGNKLNNNINNLEWCTYSENIKHAFKIGLRKSLNGNNSPYHKLLENNVLTIHGLYLSGFTLKEIGLMYNISYVQISNIINGKLWKQLIGVK